MINLAKTIELNHVIPFFLHLHLFLHFHLVQDYPIYIYIFLKQCLHVIVPVFIYLLGLLVGQLDHPKWSNTEWLLRLFITKADTYRSNIISRFTGISRRASLCQYSITWYNDSDSSTSLTIADAVINRHTAKDAQKSALYMLLTDTS